MSHSITHPPSPAVEVVATLGDSVVGVAHVNDPRGGTTRPLTRGLIIGGAIAIAAGAIAFLAATHIASINHDALAAWVARHKPAWSFRPEFVPTWYSVVSLLGLSLGLTALVSGLSRRRRDLEPSVVTIGTAAGVDFAIDGIAAPARALVAPQGEGFVLDLTGMTGEITPAAGAKAEPITQMATALPVTEGLRVRAQLGQVSFHISATERPRRQTTPMLALLDRRALGFVAASAAAHLALWAIARTVPPDAMQSQVNFDALEDVSYRLVNVTNEVAPPEPDKSEVGDTSGEDGKMALEGPMGTVGSLNQHSTDPATRQIKNRDIDQQLARKEAIEAATSAGVLGSTMVQDQMFSSLVGTGEVSSGLNDLDIEGAVIGDGAGAPYGFGQNVSGNGFGGGGTSFVAGSYNTIRNGNRVGEGFGIPGSHGCKATSGLCKGKPEVVPPVIGKPTVIGGDYDASIIRRYVKRKVSAIGYCYENQLLAHPDLEGTVMAEWTINMSGLVTDARAKGVSPDVASCIATVISTIEFPKPPQVGVYQVRYPFVLHKHGQ